MAGGQKLRHIRKSIRRSAQYHRLSKKERKAEVAFARVEVARQVKGLALELGIGLDDVARYMGVAVRNFYYWCAGGKIPNEGNFIRLLLLKGELEAGRRDRISTGAVIKISGVVPWRPWDIKVISIPRNP